MVKRDVAYDYIRIFAMIVIILCHYFQVLNYYSAFSWLNIGVQIFFVLSAKLLCEKDLTTRNQVLSFYKTRILRICLPVWIYLICLVPMLYLVGRGPDFSAVVLYLLGMAGFAPSGILGLGHFWYITVLLLCYLLVPILNYIDRISTQTHPLRAFLLKAMPSAVVVLLFAMTPWMYFGVNIALFVAAYFYFRSHKHNREWDKNLSFRLLPFALLAILSILYINKLTEIDAQLYELIYTSAKSVIGMLLFALLHLLFSRFMDVRFSRLTTVLSNTSYEVYIVHQFILLSLLEYVPIFSKNGLINQLVFFVASLLLIAVNTAVLYIVKTKIESRLRRPVTR